MIGMYVELGLESTYKIIGQGVYNGDTVFYVKEIDLDNDYCFIDDKFKIIAPEDIVFIGELVAQDYAPM